ncbi:MAG: hypothetical protein H7X70_03775 [Candidatus Kapabacteria bacterium]|nr:hypothetical protein [Candidatus Kapabacteria bacterium]
MRIIIFLFAVLCALPLAAQDTTVIITNEPQSARTVGSRLRDENFFAIGLQAGVATGSGLAFRFSSASRFAGEIVMGYVAIRNPVWSFGGELQYLLSNSSSYRFYALGGMSVNYVDKDGTNSLTAPARIGIGVGYEWFVSENISLGAELPITIFLKSPTEVFPTPQLHMMFYFQ